MTGGVGVINSLWSAVVNSYSRSHHLKISGPRTYLARHVVVYTTRDQVMA